MHLISLHLFKYLKYLFYIGGKRADKSLVRRESSLPKVSCACNYTGSLYPSNRDTAALLRARNRSVTYPDSAQFESTSKNFAEVAGSLESVF